jgi:hypothetical protein
MSTIRQLYFSEMKKCGRVILFQFDQIMPTEIKYMLDCLTVYYAHVHSLLCYLNAFGAQQALLTSLNRADCRIKPFDTFSLRNTKVFPFIRRICTSRMAFLTLRNSTSTKRFCWFIRLGFVWLSIIWFLRQIVRRTHMAHVEGMIF